MPRIMIKGGVWRNTEVGFFSLAFFCLPSLRLGLADPESFPGLGQDSANFGSETTVTIDNSDSELGLSV